MVAPETEVLATRAGVELWRRVLTPGHYVLGSAAGCDLRIEAPGIAAEHAGLTVYEFEIFLEALSADAGVAVNGRPAQGATRIWPGQRVALGEVQLALRRVRASGDESAGPQAELVRRLLPAEFLRGKKYDLGAVVAQGGMGAILAAQEVATARTVAMKVMLHGDSTESVARFITEARVTARLEHPGIVPVYELGLDEHEQLFYTMKYVRGVTLREVLRRLAESDPPTLAKYPLPVLLTAFQKVCDAIAFAHSRGVLHRDLKPENVMLGEFGEVLVMDWGVAKEMANAEAGSRNEDGAPDAAPSAFRVPHSAFATLAGAILGTPQYMPPEQASGEHARLDERADIYALGAILYHLLTLRPAVEGERTEVLAKVRGGDIVPPAEAVAARGKAGVRHLPGRRMPDSLAAVAMKAMAPRPEDRYPSVAELQADVAAYQNGRATSAERAGFFKQLALAIRRHRREAALLGAALLLLLAVSALFTVRLIRERNRAEAGETAATSERRRSEQTLTRLQLQRAEELFDAGDDSGGLAYLAHVLRRDPDDRATAGRLLSALRDQSHLRPLLELPRQESAVQSLEWSPDGRRLLTHGRNLVRIWDAEDGRPRVGPVKIPDANHAVRFSPDGRRFVAIGTDFQVYDAESGRPVGPLLVHTGRYESTPSGQRTAVFSPDGATLITTTWNEFLHVWDVESGKRLHRIPLQPKEIPERPGVSYTWLPTASVLAPDGAFHAIARVDGQIVLRETGAWKTVRVLGDLQTFTASPAFSPEGKRMFFVQGRAIRGIELPSLKPLAWHIECPAEVAAYAVHPEGSELAVATADRQVRFFDAESGRQRPGALAHTRDVRGVQWSRDGSRLLVQTDPSSVQIWETASRRPIAARCPLRGDVVDLSLDGSGQRLAVAASDGSVRVWQVAATEALPTVLPVRSDGARPTVALHPDGKLLATTSLHTAQVWDWTTGRRAGPLLNHEPDIWSAIFTPGGDRLLTGGSEDKQVRTWDYRAGREVGARFHSLGYLRHLGFPDTGNRFCIAGVAVCDLATGWRSPDFARNDRFALISPDGRRVAATLGPDGTRKWIARLHDSETAAQIGGDIAHVGPIVALAVSPDSRAFVTGAEDGTARVWSLADARPLSPWIAHLAAVKHVAFSPDSRRLLTVSAGRAATVWDWEKGAPIGAPVRLPAAISTAAFSPDGARFATASADGSVRLWESATGRPLSAALPLLASGDFPRARLLWIPDGRHLLFGGGGSPLVHVWDAPPAKETAPAWLADCAEAVGGQRLGAGGELEALPEAAERATRERLAALRGDDLFTRTARWLIQAPALRPISPDATLRREDLVARLSDAASASAAMQALRLDPADGRPWAALCWQRLQSSAPLTASEAEELTARLQRAEALSPRQPLVWAARAAMHERHDRRDDAIVAWGRAVELAPDDAVWRRRMGEALARNGDPSGAADAFAESIALAGDTVFDDVELAALHGARAAALEQLGRHEEALPDRAIATRFPRRSPEATPRQIDLTLHYNRPLQIRIGMAFIQGLHELTPGLHTIAGVSFDARGSIDLSDLRHDLKPRTETRGIRIAQDCRALHFLHAAHFGGKEPARALAEYVVHYADGSTAVVPAINTRDIAQSEHHDAWTASPPLVVAWTGKHDWHSGVRQPRSVSLYKMTWRNPHPDKRIESLDFRLVPPSASPFLVAITAE